MPHERCSGEWKRKSSAGKPASSVSVAGTSRVIRLCSSECDCTTDTVSLPDPSWLRSVKKRASGSLESAGRPAVASELGLVPRALASTHDGRHLDAVQCMLRWRVRERVQLGELAEPSGHLHM